MAGRILRVAALVVVMGAVALGLAQRTRLERAWVAYRLPSLQERARAMLVEGLAHPDKFVRIDCARLLARLGEPQGFAVLRRTAADHNAMARWTALAHLVQFEERALPILERALQDEEVFVRGQAITVLGHVDSAAARDLLRRQWPDVAGVGPVVVLDAWWRAMPAEAAALVRAELRKPDILSQEQVIQQWIAHRRDLYRYLSPDALQADDAYVAAVLETAVAAAGPDARHAARTQQSLARAILAGEEATRIAALPLAQRQAARAEGRARRLAALPPAAHDAAAIRTQLSDPDADRRAATAVALWDAPTAAALAAAEERLREEDVDRVRLPLTRLLVLHAPARAVPHVIYGLQHERPYLRNDMADLIRHFPHPALVPAYEAALESEFAYARLVAVTALGEVKHPDRYRLLSRALDDPHANVQVYAAGGLLMPW